MVDSDSDPDYYTMDFVDSNKHLRYFTEVNFDSSGPFNGRFVEQVLTSMESVLKEICHEANIEQYHDITTESMLRRTNITRNKLAYWLETLKYLMNNRAMPLLEKALRVQNRVEMLQEDKIKDKETIIQLQSKILEKHDEQIESVQATVQKEIKTYSGVVSKSCAAALAPSKIQTAVRKVNEEADRSRNLVIYGVDEGKDENIDVKVDGILQEIEEKLPIETVTRIGMKQADKCRPVKVTLRSSDSVNQVLKKSKMLRTKAGFKSTYICPDRSLEERRAFKKLLEELRAKRSAETDSDKVNLIRNNKIITIDKKSEPLSNG